MGMVNAARRGHDGGSILAVPARHGAARAVLAGRLAALLTVAPFRPNGAAMLGFASLLGFIATIPAANWLIGHVGTVCSADGPCLVPVGFGLMAPSGVVMAGLALVLRDVVQRFLGIGWSLAAVVVGAALSWFVAPPALAIASGAAFLFSELADTAVYTPLARRRLFTAVIASSLVGTVIDSALFLRLAFGDVTHLPGLVLGKAWMALAATLVLWLMRRRIGAVPAGR